MATTTTNLLLRHDTILGVCEAIGRDLGFHPNWLRVTFAALIYLSPLAVIGTYLGLGLLVALTRWVAPDTIEAGAAAKAAFPTEFDATPALAAAASSGTATEPTREVALAA